jgi:6-phosphogluconolactonase
MTTPGGEQVIVYPDADGVAEALAARLTARLVELQRDSRVPQVALTGGRIATQAYRRLAEEGGQSAVDWSQVELWWGDERFVAGDDADRNDYAILQTLTEALPLSEERIHRMPASDGGLGLDAAAEAYDQELGDTVFDVCLLGMGPDGHVASLFPGHPSSSAPGRVIPVRKSPKPPPDRISLTLEVINASTEVWFLVAGHDKAEAARMALSDGGDAPVPAAGVSGVQRTLWLVDRQAAGELPPELLTEA